MELLTEFFLHPIQTIQVGKIFDGKTKIQTPRYFDSKNMWFCACENKLYCSYSYNKTRQQTLLNLLFCCFPTFQPCPNRVNTFRVYVKEKSFARGQFH